MGNKVAKADALQPMKRSIDVESFMGRWYVKACIPTYFEVGACNSTEDYELHVDSKGNKEVSVTFTYQGNFNEKPKQLFQKAKVISETGTQWAISPYVLGVALPLGLPYLVLDCGKNYEYTVIGMPQRQYLWIMERQRPGSASAMSEELYNEITSRCENEFGYDLSGLVKVPFD